MLIFSQHLFVENVMLHHIYKIKLQLTLHGRVSWEYSWRKNDGYTVNEVSNLGVRKQARVFFYHSNYILDDRNSSRNIISSFFSLFSLLKIKPFF